MKNVKIKLNFNGILETFIMDSKISYHVHKKRPAIIICPGGGYMIHATKESEPIAVTFMEKGYHCFILKYAVAMDRDNLDKEINPYAKYPIPVLQLMEAIHIIKENAESWHIDREEIYIMGFSAGGHVCATLGVRWNDKALISQLSFVPQNKELKPAGMVLGYPMLRDNSKEFYQLNQQYFDNETSKLMKEVLYQTRTPTQNQQESINLINYVSENTIPTFIWHSTDDSIIDSTNSTKFISTLISYGIPCEYHLFGHGSHGKSLASDLIAMNDYEIDNHLHLWTVLANHWMQNKEKFK